MANYKRSTHALVKQAGEELVVLHSKSGNYYTLNPLGRQIWDFCQTPKSEEEIVPLDASYQVEAHDIFVFTGTNKQLERIEK